MWSVTAGRCSWCESCCSVLAVTPTWSRACRASAPTCSPLACRDLEADGVIERTRVPAPTPAVLYQLTANGRDLRPVLDTLAVWGTRRLTRPTSDEAVEPRWFVLSLAAHLDPAELDSSAELHARHRRSGVHARRLRRPRRPSDGSDPGLHRHHHRTASRLLRRRTRRIDRDAATHHHRRQPRRRQAARQGDHRRDGTDTHEHQRPRSSRR